MCYFATDIHSHSLGEGKNDDSLQRAGDIKGELVMVCLIAIEFFLVSIIVVEVLKKTIC